MYPLIPGATLNYFSPKRFNRFPRFSAVMKGYVHTHLDEKTISLNQELFGL